MTDNGTFVITIPPGGIPLKEIERQAILSALELAHGVQKAAAKLLSISPRVINYKMRTHGIWH